MVVKKLPKGSTLHYIQALNNFNFGDDLLSSLREHYPRLTFDTTTKRDFLAALVKAAGRLKSEGWIWRTYSVADESVESLKILYELMLTDASLLMPALLPPADLKGLNFDYHFKSDESKQTALDFVKFISLHGPYSDYTEYVITPDGRALATKFIQDEATATTSSSSGGKRKRDEEDEEAGGEASGATPKKLAKKGGIGKWYWADDGKGAQDTWVEYDATTANKLEKGFSKKQKTVKVDTDRFVDLQAMVQRRYDDTQKRRAVKREVLTDASDDEEEEEEKGEAKEK